MDNKANRPSTHRRDGAGRLDPQYAADLLAIAQETARPNDDDARSFGSGDDPFAEQLGETFVKTATSGEDCAEDAADEVVPEESGGPFIESSGKREFAHDTDASNPKDAGREPFPRTSRTSR